MSDDRIDIETGEVNPSVSSAPEPALPTVVAGMRPLASAMTTEVCTALAAAQGEFQAPKRTKKAIIRPRDGGQSYEYSYAPLEEIIRVMQAPFAKHGLSRQQYIVSRSGMWFVRTIIWHISGEWISSDYPIFAEAMTAQRFASGVTYAKRQGLCLVGGLAPEDDDDAQIADAKPAADAARGTSGGRGATKANPAVAPSTQGEDRAREAYRRLQTAIDTAQHPEGIYLWDHNEWAPDLADDAALVAGVSQPSLERLKERLKWRMSYKAEVGMG